MVYSTLMSMLLSSVLAYDDTSCSYFSTHVVAEPLSKCAAYSYSDIQYSWDFVCDDQDKVLTNYYESDTECTDTAITDSIGVDAVGGTVQCMGSGSNCHTVDIKVKGFTDSTSAECNDETDWFSFSFVIDECIPSILESAEYSAILSCDAEKLYLSYYTGCTDCRCDMETYTYEYYDDFDGCWDVLCGSHEQYGSGTPKDVTPPPVPVGKCANFNSKHHANKLKEILSRPMDFTKASYHTAKTKAFGANVINGDDIETSSTYLYNKLIMNWIYIVAVGCAVILLGGAWKCIKQKEYSLI